MRSRTPAVRKPTLSPTKIGTFLECAVKYRYVYVDRIGKFYLKARPGFSFGSSLHHVLQGFHEQGGGQTLEEMTDALESGWISAGYATREQEREHLKVGLEIVASYHAAQREPGRESIETIATEKTITWDFGSFKLTGRVDRIDRHGDGTLEIVDYKSGRMEVTPEEVAASLAMSCYQLILKQLYPASNVCATIYCLRSGASATSTLTMPQMAEFEADIRRIADVIMGTQFDAVRPVHIDACRDCDFLSRCSTFWRQQEREAAESGSEFSDAGL